MTTDHDARVRRWIDIHSDDVASVFDTVSMSEGLSLEEKGDVVAAVCRAARKILEARPDAGNVLARQDPVSAETEAAWLRMVAEGRRRRALRARAEEPG